MKLCVILFIQRSAKPALLSCEIQFSVEGFSHQVLPEANRVILS